MVDMNVVFLSSVYYDKFFRLKYVHFVDVHKLAMRRAFGLLDLFNTFLTFVTHETKMQ